MNAHRVLVVDDSAFMRKILSDIISADPNFEIVATAANGREALESVTQWKPDVITMDLEMPEMNGLEALRQIMRIYRAPVIMLSSISDDGARETIKALQYGAFDFIRKPSGPLSPDIHSVGEQLLEKLRIAVMTKRQTPVSQTPQKPAAAAAKAMENLKKVLKPRKPAKPPFSNKEIEEAPPATKKTKDTAKKPDAAKLSVLQPDESFSLDSFDDMELDAPRPKAMLKPTSTFRHLIAIGTSTGGPRALHEVISALPGNLPAPVLVVQHMPPKFTRSLAQRLDNFSSVHVREAEHNERVYAGTVYIAPGGYHMRLSKDAGGYLIKLSQEPPQGGHRPSVDIMFESCAAFPELKRHAVIMTGMGSDGVKGMRAINESGGENAIAEAEESCIVYGMPRSAVEAGVAKSVMPLRQIAPALIEAVRG
ncbi:protein-glutamate methylesterase/protein-glutamine glutaminase [Paenibacillus nasutitermitis]|uniref:Protein-glutamate methylesterase/protein-glutamine glutaminase n=1 Tax=Paenibacillus nasutitermitis TaxID=1652958 RepID=A0A916YYY6_9BACL|nr:chemotaxis response regulator protein-glutamate methylesterase [Paenibacillus nasutitermitis]GGD68220.1 chemotaxis response regulator protein-glutamate methylesterase [Paenibacillus nasutitermitis]